MLSFATTWMGFEDIMLNERSQRKMILHDATYTWNQKNTTN